MTKLDAINLIFRKCGIPPVLALQTGQSTEAGWAEDNLNTAIREVLGRGWAQNTDYAVAMRAPTDRIVITAGNGFAFTLGEPVTEGVTGATGNVQAVVTTSGTTELFITRTNATVFTGTQTLTGSASGATRSGGARNAIADGFIRIGTDWLRTVPGDREPKALFVASGRLFNATDRTHVFAETVYLTITRLLTIEQMTEALAKYCALLGAQHYQNYRKRGIVDAQLIGTELQLAKIEAEEEDTQMKRLHPLHTRAGRAFRGNRHTTSGNAWEREDYG